MQIPIAIHGSFLEEFEEKNKEETDKLKAAEKEQEEAQKNFKEFETKDAKLQETIKPYKEKVIRDEKLMQGEQQKIDKAIRAAKELRESIPEKEEALKRVEEGKKKAEADLEADMVDINKQAEHLGHEKEAKEAELLPLKNQQAEHRREVTELTEEANILRNKQDTAKNALDNMKHERKIAAETAKTSHTRAQKWKARAESIKTELKQCKEHMEAWDVDIPELQKVRQETKTKFEELKYKAASTRSQGQLLDAIMGASRSGALKGIHGRLGDCGSIDQKYDTAICNATNCLDYLVVDNAKEGQNVIEFVRANKLGRVNIIALDKMEKHVKKSGEFKFPAPEKVKRLYDCIKCDKKYKGAFWFAVRDTLVANDIEQASRIGLKGNTAAERHRVVTLDGKLIEPSGTLTGGGSTKVTGGGMSGGGEIVTEEMVAQAQAEYQEMQGAYEQAMLAREQSEKQHTSLTEEQDEIGWKQQKADMDAKAAQAQLTDFDARIKAHVVPQLSAEDKARIKDIEKEVGQLDKKHHKFNEKVDKLEGEVNKLHESILNAGAAKKDAHKKTINEWEKKIRTVKDDISKTNVDAENADKQADFGEKQVNKALKMVDQTREALASAEAEYATLEERAMEVVDAYTKATDVLKELGEFCEKIRVEREETKRKTNEIKRKEVEYQAALTEKMNVLQNQMTRWRTHRERLEETRKLHKELPFDLLTTEEEEEPKKKVPLEDEELDENQMEMEKEPEVTVNAINEDLSEEDLAEVDQENVRTQILALKQNMDQMRPNVAIISEYREKLKVLEKRNREFQEVHDARQVILRKLEDLKQRRFNEFMDGFNTIAIKLKEMYQMLTLGGDAELELVDQGDPFSEGICFSVRPPKKSWKQMTNLSGGEKTLSSLALVFALHHYRPTPLYFMDEIDAALDYRNVSIIANYVKRRTKDAQFIIISLRNHMFELSDRLVGVYKTNDASKSVGIYPYRLERGDKKAVRFSQEITEVEPVLEDRTNNVPLENLGKSPHPKSARMSRKRKSLVIEDEENVENIEV
eukprot:gene273-846_t